MANRLILETDTLFPFLFSSSLFWRSSCDSCLIYIDSPFSMVGIDTMIQYGARDLHLLGYKWKPNRFSFLSVALLLACFTPLYLRTRCSLSLVLPSSSLLQ